MFRMQYLGAVGVAVTGFASVAAADEEEHFDVWLRIVEDTFVTGAISEEEEPLDPFHRIFGAEFGIGR